METFENLKRTAMRFFFIAWSYFVQRNLIFNIKITIQDGYIHG